MTVTTGTPQVPGRRRDLFVRFALVVSLALPVFLVVAALGTRFGLWPWTIGLGVLTMQIGSMWLMAAAAIGLLALVVAVAVKPRRGWVAALVAIAVPAGGLAYGNSVRQVATSLPPIHDISTNPDLPPLFSDAVMAQRATAFNGNPVLPPNENITAFSRDNVTPFSGRSFAELQREAYPGIQPVLLTGVTVADAHAKAKEAATALGWAIVTDDVASGRLEAVETSFWFGFKDDIVVMISQDGAGVRVDARSVSRVGRSDLGMNAKRLEAFLERMQ